MSSERPLIPESRLFWKLYRKERRKFGSFKDVLSAQQITHAAREARRALDEKQKPRP